jgi:peptidoglycan hydrolase-like protein with peptidoglycan-binding domain
MNNYPTSEPVTDPSGQWTRPTASPANAARGKRNTRLLASALTVSGIALVGAAAAFVMAFTSPASAHAITPSAPSGAPSAPVVPYTPPAVPYTPPPVPYTPPVQPSASITTLQQELGQLNYYEGPVDGMMNSQLTQAITYLQRDAGLPRTGAMDSATSAALASMLVTGNNQMAG